MRRGWDRDPATFRAETGIAPGCPVSCEEKQFKVSFPGSPTPPPTVILSESRASRDESKDEPRPDRHKESCRTSQPEADPPPAETRIAKGATRSV